VAQRPISDAMSSPVLCVRGGNLLGDALQVMVRSARRHLVVIDDASGCIGVLADRAAAAWAHDPAAFLPRVVDTDAHRVPIGIVTGSDLIRLLGG
jgi:CBS domain-containing protein